MTLLELNPQWLDHGGQRIGFMFRSPTKATFWQTCMFAPTMRRVQREAIAAIVPDEAARANVQMCNPDAKWTATTTDFASMSVQPSLDGSAGGLWHGHITNGQIVGGI